MRGCLTTIVVLVVLAVLADLGLSMLIERAAAERVESQIDAESTVDVQGWPATVRLLGGGADAVVTSRNVPLRAGDARLTRTQIRLRDVHVQGGTIRVRGGRFTASLNERDLSRILSVPPELPLARLRLVPGSVRLELGGLPATTAKAVVDGNRLVLRPDNPQLARLSFAVPLDGLPYGLRVDTVRIRRGRLDVSGSLRGAALRQLQFPLFAS